MSLHSIGYNQSYVLPANTDAVPDSFMSNKNAKPIPSSLQTVNIPSLSGNQSAGGTSVIQIPLGNSAGYMCNPYITFNLALVNAGGAVATSQFSFKGGAGAATACINSIQSYVNSVQIDNLQNADMIYDQLLCHSTSNDWLTHDGTILLGATPGSAYPTAVATSFTANFCVPLIGLLGSQQAFPLFLCNGVMQIQLNWNQIVRIYGSVVADPVWTSATFSNVQLVYDRISPEQAFVDSVRNNMMQGNKFVYSYSNFQNTTFAGAASTTFNFGLNVSSLRGIIASQVLTADLTGAGIGALGYSVPVGLSSFQVTLDGRNINSNTLRYAFTLAAAGQATPVYQQSIVFAELQRAIGRVFDAGISDVSTATTYNTQNFAVGVSAQRVNEGNMAFSGSPVSIASVQITEAGANPQNYSWFMTFMADYQLLIDASGSVEIVR
jgi:hypothetical protein